MYSFQRGRCNRIDPELDPGSAAGDRYDAAEHAPCSRQAAPVGVEGRSEGDVGCTDGRVSRTVPSDRWRPWGWFVPEAPLGFRVDEIVAEIEIDAPLEAVRGY